MKETNCPGCPTLIQLKCADSRFKPCLDPQLSQLEAREVVRELTSQDPNEKANVELLFEMSLRQFSYGKIEEAAKGLQTLQEDFGLSAEEIAKASQTLYESDQQKWEKDHNWA